MDVGGVVVDRLVSCVSGCHVGAAMSTPASH